MIHHHSKILEAVKDANPMIEIEDEIDKRTDKINRKIDKLEDMIAFKMEKIQKTLEELKDTQEKLKAAGAPPEKYTIHWMDPKEIDDLFEESSKHQEEIKGQLKEMKKVVEESSKIFAVDAPDGEADAYFSETQQQVDVLLKR